MVNFVGIANWVRRAQSNAVPVQAVHADFVGGWGPIPLGHTSHQRWWLITMEVHEVNILFKDACTCITPDDLCALCEDQWSDDSEWSDEEWSDAFGMEMKLDHYGE